MAAAYAAIANGGILRPPHIDPGGRRQDAGADGQARDLADDRRRSCARCSRASSPRAARPAEVSIPGYTLAGKTGTANKIDPTTGDYSKTAYVASFVGFAPASDPKLLVAVMVDEPQGGIYGGDGRGARVRADHALRAAVPADPARVASRPAPAMTAARADLARDARGRRRPDVEVTGLAYDSRERAARARCSSACRGFTRDGHDFAPDAVARGAVALVVERPLGLGVPEVVGRRRPRGDGARRRALPRRPDRARCASSASPAPTARRPPPSSSARCSRPRGAPTGLLGTVDVGRRRARARRSRARRPRRSTCRPTFARDARRRRRAPARWRSPRTRSSCSRADAIHLAARGVHEPHPGPPRLPPDDGGLLRSPSAGCSRPADGASRSSTSTTPTARGWPRELAGAIDRSPSTRDADCARRRRALELDGTGFDARRAGRRLRAALAAAGPLQRRQRARRDRRGARARRRRRTTIAAALPRGRPRARALRAGRRGPGLRRARRLRPHADSLENVLRARARR